MDEERLDVGGAISYGWRMMVDNILFFVLLFLIFLVVTGIFYGIGGAFIKYPVLTTIMYVIGFLVTVYIHMAIVNISLKIYNEEKADFRDIFTASRFFWRFLLADILYNLMVTIGLVLCIIPGIYFGIKYHFFGYIIIEQDMGVLDSLKKSWQITNGAWWDLFLLAILLWLIALAGVILCGVGVLFAWPIIFMAVVYAYKRIVDTAPRIVEPIDLGMTTPPVPPPS
jgi:uncharacterized membrane protein